MRSEFVQRIRNKSLLSKVSSADDAARLVKDGMALGVGTGDQASCPKTFLTALANRQSTEKLTLKLFTAGPAPSVVERILTVPGVHGRKYGQLADRKLAEVVNSGEVSFIEERTGLLPYYIQSGRYDKIDLAIVEAVSLTEEGYIVPSTSLLDGPACLLSAKSIIVEINTQVPAELEGIHDIYSIGTPPHRKPVPIQCVGDRVGTPFVPVDIGRIAAIIDSTIPDKCDAALPLTENSRLIAGHLAAFLANEIAHGALPPHLLPLQVGIGNIPEAITAEIANSCFDNLEFFTGAVSDGILDLIDAGKVTQVSCTALYFSQQGFDRFYRNLSQYKKYFILRPSEIADCPEVCARLGVIALNGAIEVDIYGHVNSTHIQGSRIIGGVGGSCDFMWNAYLSIVLLSSTAAKGAISTIVPMVSHVDHPEHAVDVIVTERGVADLRGLDPVEKARVIIANCAHPDYISHLDDYLSASLKYGGHEPHLLKEAFSFHTRFIETGTMRF